MLTLMLIAALLVVEVSWLSVGLCVCSYRDSFRVLAGELKAKGFEANAAMTAEVDSFKEAVAEAERASVEKAIAVIEAFQRTKKAVRGDVEAFR